ncbi:acetyltransferase [Psychroflexus sp. CAK8W]|uniref:Acetyltransferase n=1 Tax=Psychroflexus longus TaxID=2873596 RepID=A0ABS7XJ38_9FLAO|nr:acetyltransferase [Psychroflexus longus]MBZ9778987.1 acetyltransferase [Psychroflexus longus]
MDSEKRELYFSLGNELPKIYSHLNFANHCYWRIALDNTLHAKWKDVIPAPAYKNISEEQYDHVIHLLKSYKEDEQLLLDHNRISLTYRGKK